MRKAIRELLEGTLGAEKDRASDLKHHVERLEKDLARARADHNEAENLVRLIQEELQRPDGPPATEPGRQPPGEAEGTGI